MADGSPRAKGKGLLAASEAKRVRGWIRDKCPDQLKLPHVLWTTGVVRELIRRNLGKDLAETTVRLYLTRWSFTPQKPLSRANQRSDATCTSAMSMPDPATAANRNCKR
jgi:transposase